jgi:hypothetical protein
MSGRIHVHRYLRRIATDGPNGGISLAKIYDMLRHTALLLIVSAACDPRPIDGGDEAAPWTPLPPKKAPTPTRAPPRPADSGALGGFADCLLRCDAPGLTRTARAECRYRCEDIDGPREVAAPSAVDVDPVEATMHCMARCPSRGEQSVACLDACEHLGADSPMAPSAAVLDELGVCITACGLERPLKPTDRSTCELNCAEVARTAGPARHGSPPP